jgi:hypothetical protein
MLRVESQWRSPGLPSRHKDFSSVDVRRLHGLLIEFEGWARSARQKMDNLIEEGQYDVSLTEVQDLVGYELGQLGLS